MPQLRLTQERFRDLLGETRIDNESGSIELIPLLTNSGKQVISEPFDSEATFSGSF